MGCVRGEGVILGEGGGKVLGEGMMRGLSRAR